MLSTHRTISKKERYLFQNRFTVRDDLDRSSVHRSSVVDSIELSILRRFNALMPLSKITLEGVQRSVTTMEDGYNRTEVYTLSIRTINPWLMTCITGRIVWAV
jgi:hypothetical protein